MNAANIPADFYATVPVEFLGNHAAYFAHVAEIDAMYSKGGPYTPVELVDGKWLSETMIKRQRAVEYMAKIDARRKAVA